MKRCSSERGEREKRFYGSNQNAEFVKVPIPQMVLLRKYNVVCLVLWRLFGEKFSEALQLPKVQKLS